MADLWQIVLILVLVLINALFSGSEIALISLRPTQIERLSERGRSGRALARLAADPNRYLATIQIGITLANFMASAAAAVSLAEPVAPLLGVLGDAAEVGAVVLVTLVLTFFTLVFGELAPKRIAMQHPEGWALFVAWPLNWIARAARPAVWLLSVTTNLVVRLTGGDPERQGDEVTEEEIRDLVAAQGSFTEEEKQIISGALEVGERSLREVLVPRQAIFSLPASMPAAEALPLIVESGHSRAPVYRGSPDDIVGVVHVRALIGTTAPVDQAMTEILAFPESADVLGTLRDLQRARQQMALVIDEHGGIEGIVTVEDLVEEIVGEIYDEFDSDVVAIVRDEDGTLHLPGSFPAHDLIDLGIEAPKGDYTTVAGLILDRLQRIPAPGEAVEIDDWNLAVEEMDRTSIARVAAMRLAPVEEDR